MQHQCPGRYRRKEVCKQPVEVLWLLQTTKTGVEEVTKHSTPMKSRKD